MFGLGLLEGLLADDFDGGDFAVLQVLDFVASRKAPLAQKLALPEPADYGGVGFAGPLFYDLRLVVISRLI